MKKIMYLILSIPFIVIGATFAMENSQSVSVSYLGIDWTGNLLVLILVSILLGVILGVLAMSFHSIKAKAQTRSVKKKLHKVEQEVQNLRALPIKDDV
ncbi:MAG: LapA family protein [Arenicella sp.]